MSYEAIIETIVWKTVHDRDDYPKLDVRSWRRHDLLKKLADDGWSDDALEGINRALDDSGVFYLGGGVSFHRVEISTGRAKKSPFPQVEVLRKGAK